MPICCNIVLARPPIKPSISSSDQIVVSIIRGGDTSMAGMAIAIPGVLNISKTGDTMGKIR